MRWTVHGERIIYDSPWMRLALTDVEIPASATTAARRFDHHVLRMPAGAAGTVVYDPQLGVLMLWRHRFVTDTWGWEIPAGRIDEGETPEVAAVREAYEETGWIPGPVRPLTTYFPHNGSSDATFHLFVADGATHVGAPTDPSESERVAWVTIADLRAAIRAGEVGDGLSLTALLWWMAFESPTR